MKNTRLLERFVLNINLQRNFVASKWGNVLVFPSISKQTKNYMSEINYLR